MSDYTPTTEEIREYVETGGEPRPWVELDEAEKAREKARGEAFDRWLAAHDAEVRAAVLAELGEPEWEYAWEADRAARAELRPRGPRIMFDEQPNTPEAIATFPRGRRIRRRKAGPWLPVEQEGEESDDELERGSSTERDDG